MDSSEQVAAYAAADFEQAHQAVLQTFEQHFPGYELQGEVLDLGCGCGDISFRFARRFAACSVSAVDGSAAMLAEAKKLVEQNDELQNRVRFIHTVMPSSLIPSLPYTAIISNSFLHHLHRPEVLWQAVNQHASAGTKILIVDLFRPQSTDQAKQFVQRYAAEEATLLQNDFYASLLAAFTVEEIEQQLVSAGLSELKVQTISDRHVLIVGEKNSLNNS